MEEITMILKRFIKGQNFIIKSSLAMILIILSSQASFAKIWCSGHMGITYPEEDGFQRIYWVPIIDVDLIPINKPWDIYFEFGYNNFKYKDISEDFYWINISTSFRYSFQMQNLNPFISVGPGFYIPEKGDNRFGAKFGLGVDYPISDRLTFEIGTDFHNVFLGNEKIFGGDNNFSFLTFHVGVLFQLK